MKYLVNKKQKYKAHIWLGSDTACTMFSTGGITADSWKISDNNGQKKICGMCKHVYYKKGGREFEK